MEYQGSRSRSFGLQPMLKFTTIRVVEIPYPTCPTWPHFIQDKLEISIYLSQNKVNSILYIKLDYLF